MNSAERIRYSRHICLPHVGELGQQKLLGAKVLIVGLGGLGSPVAMYLAAAGVGTLGLAEFDRVEVHNLQRQIIHGESNVGQSKLESATARLREINPGVNLVPHPEGVTIENAVELFKQYDLIIDGTDNFPTRFLNNDAAVLAGVPLLYGSIFQYEGQVSLFDPSSEGPCYRCLFPEMPDPDSVPNCATAGVFGALCGVVGSLQAMEAVKYLLGVGEPLVGRLLSVDVLTHKNRRMEIRRNPDCPVCGKTPTIRSLEPARYVFSCELPETVPDKTSEEISIGDARNLLDAVWLDVREDFEVVICSIENSIHIPMGELHARVAEISANRPIVVYCHHGMRSLSSARLLREHGVDRAQSLVGGIDAWAREVEPQMARY